MIRINNNQPALLACFQAGDAQNKVFLTMEHLATGLRFIRVAHDPVNLGISEKMRSRIRCHNQVICHVQQKKSILQPTEGGIKETHSLLRSIRELVLSGLEGVKTSSDCLTNQEVIPGYLQETDQIAANNQLAINSYISYFGRDTTLKIIKRNRLKKACKKG